MKGLKLRFAPVDLMVAIWKHLGCNVITLPWTEIYEGLGRGMNDACTSPVALVESMKFYEQAKHIIRTDAFPQDIAFMTNYKQCNALSSGLKKVVLDAHKEAGAYSYEIMAKSADEGLERMKEKGSIISVIDRDPLVRKCRELYEKWEADGTIPKGFLKAVADLSSN